MTYPFVQAFNDYGAAKGPRLGITWHMAEGGGTVAYLAKDNPNGVSVHFVVETSGRIVQMLLLSHANGSIRPTAIRTSDDAPYPWAGAAITYGATAAAAVLGAWHRDPNSATIGVEVEGFAKDGPNAVQAAALVRLYADLANRFPGIRSLAHRDFADYKGCPGHLFPWDRVGGHGPEGDPMAIYTLIPVEGRFTIPANTAVKAYRPAADGWAVAKTWPAGPASSAAYDARLGRLSGTTQPSSLLRVSTGALAGLYLSTADVDEVDAPRVDDSPYSQADLDAAIAADRAKARIVYQEA